MNKETSTIFIVIAIVALIIIGYIVWSQFNQINQLNDQITTTIGTETTTTLKIDSTLNINQQLDNINTVDLDKEFQSVDANINSL